MATPVMSPRRKPNLLCCWMEIVLNQPYTHILRQMSSSSEKKLPFLVGGDEDRDPQLT